MTDEEEGIAWAKNFSFQLYEGYSLKGFFLLNEYAPIHLRGHGISEAAD
jgi:hypothetical protein